ncbi:uncharacterized protein LOC141628559 [Silene latifolia]|uniref:uncharacterized protein LOC141628559 n=1 Tax=Silene latifolia TaxID=37657 RepID=UPI003D77CAF9
MYPCERLEEVRQRATTALRLEEDIQARKGITNFDKPGRKIPIEKKDERAKPYNRPNISKIAEKTQQVDDSQHPPKLSEYGFNTGMEGLLKALRGLGDQVRWPKPPTQDRPNDDRDNSKRCEWHQDIGHRTEDCYRLRKEVKFQVRRGNLDHLLSRGGGFELSGLTYSAAKRKATGSKGDHQETSCRVSQSNLPPVTFDKTDIESGAKQHDDALTITLSIGNCTVRKALVNTGSSVNLIMLETLKTMGFDKENLIKKSIPLVGFSGEIAHSVGEITIPTYIEAVNKLVRYLVIEGPTTYNVILGRPWLHQMKTVPSTYHQCLKFPTPWGTVTVKGDREESRNCYAQALKATTRLPSYQLQDRGTSKEYKEPPSEELDQVHLDEEHPDRTVLIGATCSEELRSKLTQFLKTNMDFSPGPTTIWFISRASDRCKLFYDILRKSQKFEWTEEHEKAFAELKSYLSTRTVTREAGARGPLFLYLSVTEAAVSAILVKEQEGVQHPIYYISKSVLPTQTRYTSFEKLALALVTASYKLRPYFESHTIHVITNYPLKTIMRKPELSGRMTKWSVHLSGYDLQFEPRTAIKSQALADFVSDFCPATRGEVEEGMLTIMEELRQRDMDPIH